MPSSTPTLDRCIFTIGHSNHSFERLTALLGQHRIAVVVDVRSSPYSRYAVHFNKEGFQRALEREGFAYRFLGASIGGRPTPQAFYDAEGHVLYDKLAASERFQQGIERLLNETVRGPVAILCGEEDPSECHRRLLIGRVLRERGIEIRHIRGDGRVQREEEVAEEEEFRKTGGQLSLFDDEEEAQWRSTRSVLPRKVRSDSSASSERPE